MSISNVTFLLVSINAFSYVLMCMDKFKARKGLTRISESTLFLVAFCFGAMGICLGMLPPISHKSSKFKFKFGIPVCIIINALSFYFMEKYVLNISI